MIRIVPPNCGSCGRAGQYTMDCGATLCFTCARDFLAMLHNMNLLANPIAAELLEGIAQRVNPTDYKTGGYMIWGLTDLRGTPYHFVSDSELSS